MKMVWPTAIQPEAATVKTTLTPRAGITNDAVRVVKALMPAVGAAAVAPVGPAGPRGPGIDEMRGRRSWSLSQGIGLLFGVLAEDENEVGDRQEGDDRGQRLVETVEGQDSPDLDCAIAGGDDPRGNARGNVVRNESSEW